MGANANQGHGDWENTISDGLYNNDERVRNTWRITVKDVRFK